MLTRGRSRAKRADHGDGGWSSGQNAAGVVGFVYFIPRADRRVATTRSGEDDEVL
jgi:hypothetical protein